jgi:hypothetical protein
MEKEKGSVDKGMRKREKEVEKYWFPPIFHHFFSLYIEIVDMMIMVGWILGFLLIWIEPQFQCSLL